MTTNTWSQWCAQRWGLIPLALEYLGPSIAKKQEVWQRLLEHKAQAMFAHLLPADRLAAEKALSNDVALLEKLAAASPEPIPPRAQHLLQELTTVTNHIEQSWPQT